MKKYLKITPLVMIFLMMTSAWLFGQRISENDALQVAVNWVTLIEHCEGSWGRCNHPVVEFVKELRINNRQVGYYCQVDPMGYVMISLYTGLAPVKAYATFGKLNINDERDPSVLFKECMSGIIDAIEEKIGPIENATNDQVDEILEINYRPAWVLLDVDPVSFEIQLKSGQWDNYASSDTLISTAWNQNWPYNMYCPGDPACTENGLNGHYPAGCGPICAAQVMKYWNWPPFWDDPYDWKLMPESLHVPANPPQQQVEATAELISEIALGINYSWACDGSQSYFAAYEFGPDILDAFQSQFQYSDDAMVSYRAFKTVDEWWGIIKEHINLNRPMPYQIMYHYIIADGWKEIGNPVIRLYHMNWGHGYACWDPDCYLPKNSWYALDELPNGSHLIEATLTKIYPECSIGPLIFGGYFKEPVPYRYFDQDATGIIATFGSGQKLQFLQNITIGGYGLDPDQYVYFYGSANDPTLMFSQGDQSKGIIIRDAAMRLRAGGSIQFKRYNY